LIDKNKKKITIDDEIHHTQNPVDIRIENSWSDDKYYNSQRVSDLYSSEKNSDEKISNIVSKALMSL